MRLFDTPESEGNDCYECPPDIDIKDRTVRRPAGLMSLEFGRSDDRVLGAVRLCPTHLMQLFYTLNGWQVMNTAVNVAQEPGT